MSLANFKSARWRELRCEYSDKFKSEGFQGCHILYDFKRNGLLPILEQNNIIDFLILDEPDYVLRFDFYCLGESYLKIRRL